MGILPIVLFKKEMITIKKTGVILAGGKSSRMGKNKALLKLEGKTFIEIAIDAFKGFDEIIIISNQKEPYLKYKIKIYEDIIKDIGPLGGIYTALYYAKHDIVVIACDTPFINCDIVTKVASNMTDKSVISLTNGFVQPLCSGYKKDTIKVVKELIDRKDYSLRGLIDIVDKEYLLMDKCDNSFLNINTPKDYDDIR